MTPDLQDDFHLFANSASGDDVVDPDVALVVAYLARELSPLQVLALEDRLATDASFRAAMQPLLDGWSAPVVSLEGGAAVRQPKATHGEIELGWRRFLAEEGAVGNTPGSVVSNASLETRERGATSSDPVRRSWQRRAMRRAAMIGIIVVPVIGVAQTIVYFARANTAAGTGSGTSTAGKEPLAVPRSASPQQGTIDTMAEIRRSVPIQTSVPATRPEQSAQPLARLTDAEFWNLVNSGSEAGGSFASENFTSNEGGFPTIITRLRAAGVTGGAYLGVGPEQNFSYIAGLRPRIAFLVDIRRQSVIQHLMYKAIFELSADRADFVSLLFSIPRPAGLNAASSIDDIWRAYMPLSGDSALYARNADRIVAHLTDTHRFALDSADVASVRYVYAAFFRYGPRITYSSSGRPPVVRVAAATPPSGATYSMLVGTVRDSTGRPVTGTRVRVMGLGVQVITNDSGRYTIPNLLTGSLVAIEAVRLGYARALAENIRINQPVATHDITLRTATMVLSTVPTPRALGSAFGQPIPPVTTVSYGGVNFAALTAALDSAGVPGSFLATEDSYRYVKDLHTRNLFIPLVGDFAGPKAIRTVGTYLREHGTPLTAFYVSNVEQYLFENQVWRAFYDNVATLPVTPASVFIRFGSSTCPIAAFLASVAAGRVTNDGDALRCVL